MRKLLLAVCLAAFVLTPGAAHAQIDAGGQLSFGDDVDFGVGARAVFTLPVEQFPLAAVGSFDYFFPGDDVTYWELNGNVIYMIPVASEIIAPYAGAGLNFARVSVSGHVPGFGDVSASDTDIGLNLLGGFQYEAGPIKPFGEVKIELGGGEQFVLSGGILFNLSPGM